LSRALFQASRHSWTGGDEGEPFQRHINGGKTKKKRRGKEGERIGGPSGGLPDPYGPLLEMERTFKGEKARGNASSGETRKGPGVVRVRPLRLHPEMEGVG